MKKIKSLRLQLTIVVGVVVILICIVLTANSIYSAGNYYGEWEMELLDENDILEDSMSSNFDENQIQEDVVTFTDAMVDFSRQGLLVMGGTILVSIWFTYWITGIMLRPLNNLTGAIQRIDEENLNQRLEGFKGSAEVGQLTASFNGMMERLEESFEIQKQFAANAAHELKTPLAIMKANLQVLNMEEKPKPEEYREFAEDVEVSLERLNQTVDSLLFLASEGVETEKETIRLKELLGQIAEQLKSRAAEQGISVMILGEEQKIAGNRMLFYRAFYNLVENAIKYNRKGGKVEVSLMEEEGKTTVQIIDTGIGIKAEDMPYIFQPFYRADKSRSQKIQGSGLGMSVVKMIFDRYGAEIELESVPEQGTSIKIHLV